MPDVHVGDVGRAAGDPRRRQGLHLRLRLRHGRRPGAHLQHVRPPAHRGLPPGLQRHRLGLRTGPPPLLLVFFLLSGLRTVLLLLVLLRSILPSVLLLSVVLFGLESWPADRSSPPCSSLHLFSFCFLSAVFLLVFLCLFEFFSLVSGQVLHFVFYFFVFFFHFLSFIFSFSDVSIVVFHLHLCFSLFPLGCFLIFIGNSFLRPFHFRGQRFRMSVALMLIKIRVKSGLC